MRHKITCCNNCSERHMACHDSCPKYLKQKKENQEDMDKIWKAKQGDALYDSMHIDSVRNTKKRMNGR